MANETMALISTITVGSGGASGIDFTSIPQTYTDLVIQLSNRDSYADFAETFMRLNGSSSSIYTYRFSRGTGTSSTQVAGASVTSFNIGVQPGSGQTANTFANMTIYIANYATAMKKLVSVDAVGENNGSAGYVQFTGGTWDSTDAITQVNLIAGFVQYSSASLYGVLKGSGGATVS